MSPANKYRLVGVNGGYEGQVLTQPAALHFVRSHYPGQTIADLVRQKIMQKIVANALGSRSSSRRRRSTRRKSASRRRRSTRRKSSSRRRRSRR